MFKSKKKTGNKKPKQEDVTWILEGVVEYLRSPSWTSPIMNFVDDNCSCFENKEENKLEYTTIHAEYKSLVEKLLYHYIRELNVNEDTFAQACNQNNGKFNKIEGMFEYIWAADDFLLFKRIMSQHNLLLEMQAISMIQEKELEAIASTSNETFKKASSPPPPYEVDVEMDNLVGQSKKEYEAVITKMSELEKREQNDLRLAIEYSRREMELLDAQAAKEQRMLEEAIRLSLESPNQETPQVAKQPNIHSHSSKTADSHPDKNSIFPTEKLSPKKEKVVELSTMTTLFSPQSTSETIVSTQPADDKIVQQTGVKSKKEKPTKFAKTLPPLKVQSASEAASDWITQSQKEVASTSAYPTSSNNKIYPDLLQTKSGIDPNDLEKRREYLKSQREKLLAIKKKERDEELKTFQKESPKNVANGDSNSKDEDREKMLSARLALADRLKREVIQKKS